MGSFAYIGCWGGNERADEHGIHTYCWDPESNDLTYLRSTLMNVRSGGTCWHPVKNILYIPNESSAAGFTHRNGGASIYTLGIDPVSGETQILGCTESFGSNPAYVATDRAGKYLLVANHGSPQGVVQTVRAEDGCVRLVKIEDESNVALFKINEAGVPEGPCDVMKYAPRAGRRTSTHCAKLAVFGDCIAVCDIDDGCVYMMGIDEKEDRLVVCGKYDGPEVASARYCVFHPTKKYLFVNNEHGKNIAALAYDENGKMVCVDTIDILPAEHQGPVQQSGIAMTPDGKYLYTLIRALNSVAAVEVKEDGKLEQIQLLALDCVSPKDCAVSPDGKHLFVAGKVSGAMLCYTIGSDGKLFEECKKTPVNNPATIAFVCDGSICR